MTSKDPKDMTASELLRWAANGEPYNGVDGNSWTYPTGKIRALVEDVTGEWPSDHEAFSIIADKIDAELAQARELSLLRGAELWAKANGWPGFRDGEDFGAWLNRCALKLPCDKDGEPWHIDDRVCPSNTGETTVVGYIFDKEACYLKLRWCGEDGRANDLASMCKRPAPEALGADGMPIKAGETVYRTDTPITEAVVVDFRKYDDGSIDVVCSEKGGKVTAFYSPSLLTHTPTDTQEQIDEDVAKSTFEYWGCQNAPCGNCPALVGGEKPFKRFGTEDCQKAMVSDLLRRQRELDARKGGE